MDFFESVVIEYLEADRSLFVNPQCCIQINEGDNPDTSGPHWYCDAVVADFRSHCVFLCEITFANPPSGLLKRLSGWNDHWPKVCKALVRDSHLPEEWPVRPWLFFPERLIPNVLDALEKLNVSSESNSLLPVSRITPLEMVYPWLYKSWNRQGEAPKPASIPEAMR